MSPGESSTSAEYVNQLFNLVFPACGARSLSHIILTHGHHDHQGGVAALLLECKRRGLHVPTVYKHNPSNDSFPLTIDKTTVTCHDMSEGQVFITDGATMKVYLTPGHCSDHACLTIEVGDLMT